MVVKSGVLLVGEQCAGRNKNEKLKNLPNLKTENDSLVINRPYEHIHDVQTRWKKSRGQGIERGGWAWTRKSTKSNFSRPHEKSSLIFLQIRDQRTRVVNLVCLRASNSTGNSRSEKVPPCVELIQRFDSSSRPPGDSGKLSVSRSNQNAVLCVIRQCVFEPTEKGSRSRQAGSPNGTRPAAAKGDSPELRRL